MWITCGTVPASYMDNPTDGRHGHYNFHKEVQYAITDFINLYVYNYPEEDYAQSSTQFTLQNYYFVVVHTTDKLLEQMTHDMKTLTNRDLCGWYSRKDLDHQYQIKGERLGRESNWARTITVSKYFDLKAVYKQQRKRIIDDKKSYKQNHYHDYTPSLRRTLDCARTTSRRSSSRFTNKQRKRRTRTIHHIRANY
eukprot:5863565-Amphidinium_carterae.1